MRGEKKLMATLEHEIVHPLISEFILKFLRSF